MKRFILGTVVGALLTSSIALAASYVAEPATFKVMVNGKEFNSDPPALVVEGSTYLPLRAMGDALGVPVEWNAELNQAEVGTTGNEINKPVNIDGNATVDGFTFSQLLVEEAFAGAYSCDVEVTNNTGKDIEMMYFTISFFDENDNRVGVANGGTIINGLKNGETKTTSLYSNDDLSKAKTGRYQITYVS